MAVKENLKRILFVPGTERHVKTFVAIVKCLPNEYECMFISLYFRDELEDILKNLSLPFKRVDDYSTKEIERLLKTENPDLIVFSFDTAPVARLFVKAAKRLNIPTLLIQEGIYHGDKYVKFSIRRYLKNFFNVLFLREYNLIERLRLLREVIFKKIKKGAYSWGHAGCTKIAVTGEFTKNLLIAEGIDANDIIITGQPRFDELYTEEGKKNQNLINPDKINILWTTENYVEAGICSKEEWRESIETVINSLKELDHYLLLIKVHPEEDSQKYEHFKNMAYIRVYENSLNELLRRCDVLISFVSTTAIEAMILDKPVIMLGFFDFTNKQYLRTVPYVKSGAAIGVYRKEDLVPTIKDAYYNEAVRKKLAEARKNFIYEHAYIQDGKASERVANLIIEIIEESKRREK